MNHIVYMSRAVRPLSDYDLQDLLAQCRRDNSLHQVTGVLFYSHGSIAQLIEGDPAVIEPLYDKISRDGRHSNVMQLVNKPIAARSFPDWSMAFHPLEAKGFATLEGFFMPSHLPPTPDTLSIADAMLIDLVRQAVFGADEPAAANLTA
ncbi:BLUF domain-containing protein [Hymenobacter sp. BT175]|uniref:BLUF domain-containing protein n=1 Tax=Hymenobacter translucens TaxID=2886507 RepID=UPI001D0EE47C|nr:BLUF domain-containing protein [Hymenobacter translucens]MCC2547264.1 BLUF domain-containing protein [Hymenobacter translucens]